MEPEPKSINELLAKIAAVTEEMAKGAEKLSDLQQRLAEEKKKIKDSKGNKPE